MSLAKKTSLAQSLRHNAPKLHFKDIIYDIFKNKLTTYKSRQQYARGLAISGFSSVLITQSNLEILNIANFMSRLENLGFIFATLPWLGALYIWDKHIRYSLISRTKLPLFDNILYLSIVPLCLALDTNLISQSNNILGLALLALSAKLYSPARKRRSYYCKKAIDKRTK